MVRDLVPFEILFIEAKGYPSSELFSLDRKVFSAIVIANGEASFFVKALLMLLLACFSDAEYRSPSYCPYFIYLCVHQCPSMHAP